jgi:arylsulfate sulfotransferase
MKNLCLAVHSCLLTTIMLALASVGCGSGGVDGPVPTGALTATQNPLVVEYDVSIYQSGASAWVEFGPDTNYGRQTSTSAATAARFQTIRLLVAGMKPSTTYHMRAHASWGSGSWVDKDQTFTTGALPTQTPTGPLTVPQMVVTQPDPNLAPAGGVELIDATPQGPTTHTLDTYVTDLNGNVIWYYDVGAGNYAFPIRPMTNGDFLIGIGSNLQAPVLREIDLAGNTVREVTLAQINTSLEQKGYSFSIADFHHDVIVLPNGHWIAIAAIVKNFTNLPGYPGTIAVGGDGVVDIDPNGNAVWAWSAFDHLDVNRHPFGLPDWTHSNALVYLPNDGNLLMSMRDQSWILKLDYANGAGAGDVLWRLGNEGDFAIAGGDPDQWFYGQHFPSLISINGSQTTLAVFDDGNFRFENTSGELCGAGGTTCISRATVFLIDESTKVATCDWQFTNELFTAWGGSINQLANGNIEFDMSQPFLPQYPAASLIQEVTQTTSPTLVWQMKLNGTNVYRGYRIPSLYPGVTWQ